MKVLIFDDELYHAQSQYRMPGLEIVFIENADDAEAVVQRERPAAVLMDYSMSGKWSGADAVSALRKKSFAYPLKIIQGSWRFNGDTPHGVFRQNYIRFHPTRFGTFPSPIA